MKVGVSISIDVTKLDKSKFYQGKKGTYADLTTFIDLDEKDQYQNNGFVTQSQTKEERQAGGEKPPILGNVKVFYTDGAQAPQAAPQTAAMPYSAGDDSDIPF